MIPVYKPYLNKDVLSLAHQALDSTWISSKGPYIAQLESELSNLHALNELRINRATVVNNGTTATHLTAKLLNYIHPKVDKIIVPNNVYVAAINAFLYDNKYKLYPIDADVNTWNYDLTKLYDVLSKADLKTTALLVVHNIGNIINVPKILNDWKDLIVIEDNCEGFLGRYDGKPSGSVSFASSISFFGNKNITSGEGGAVIAPQEYQSYLYTLRSQGQSNIKFVHSCLGYNYRMTNIQAAILMGQINVLNDIVSKKKKVFDTYKTLLSQLDEVKFQKIEKGTQHSNWMLGIRLKNNKSYDDLEKFFAYNYIEVRPMFYPINVHGHLKDLKTFGGDDVAKQLSKEWVILPSYPELQDHEIQHVVNVLKLYLSK